MWCERLASYQPKKYKSNKSRQCKTKTKIKSNGGGAYLLLFEGGTSVLGVLFALPLLGAGRVGSRRPVRIELHVQLALAPRQLIVLGLLLAAQRVPLNKNIYHICIVGDFQREKKIGNNRVACLHIGGGHQEKRVVCFACLFAITDLRAWPTDPFCSKD